MNDRSRPTSEQLKRLAVVYIRQSSPGQVLNNVESRERQYEFTERAVSRLRDRVSRAVSFARRRLVKKSLTRSRADPRPSPSRNGVR